MKKVSTSTNGDTAKTDGESIGKAVIPLQIFLPANIAKPLLHNASKSNLSPENYVLFVLDFHLGKGSLLDHYMYAPVSYE